MSDDAGMIDKIMMVTISCSDLEVAREAYCRCLFHEVAGEGQIPEELARLWGLEAVAGAEYALLAPEADDRHFIRLIQTEAGPDYRPFTTFGWNAVEIAVSDVDALADSLADSPFAVIGPPCDLSFTDKIRACQVMGPAGEILYLTQIKGPVPGFELPRTGRPVAHCFVMILGAADMGGAKTFYCEQLGAADSPVIEARLTVLSAAFGLPREHRHKISALALNPGYLIEVDEFPATAVNRRQRTGSLPPGIAIVSLDCNNPPNVRCDKVSGLDSPPYNGKQVGFCKGPCGEMLELVHN